MNRTAGLTLTTGLLTLMLAASPALAQVITPNVPSSSRSSPAPDGPVGPAGGEIDRVSGQPFGPRGGGGGDGVKIVRPGAFLFASYDVDHDGRITDAEIEAGALVSFAIADKNHDGVLTGFEQSDWAGLVGSANDVLSNPAQFDTDLDHVVTKAEFVAGIHRLAKTLMKPGQTVLTYADLVQPLQRPGPGAQASGDPPPQQPGSRRQRHYSVSGN